MSSRLLIAATGAILLAGCQTAAPLPQAGSADMAWGEASKYNAAIQTINPTPVYPAGAAQPGDNGVKAAEALKRYRTDKVKAVETMQTTTSSSGGSSR